MKEPKREKKAVTTVMHVRLSDPMVLRYARALACAQGQTLSEFVSLTLEKIRKGEKQAPPAATKAATRKSTVMHVCLSDPSILEDVSRAAAKKGMTLSKYIELHLREAIDNGWTKAMIHEYVSLTEYGR